MQKKEELRGQRLFVKDRNIMKWNQCYDTLYSFLVTDNPNLTHILVFACSYQQQCQHQGNHNLLFIISKRQAKHKNESIEHK